MADPIRQPVHPPRPHPPVRVRPRRALHRTLVVPEEAESARTPGPQQPARPALAPRNRTEQAHPAPAPEPREKTSVLPRAVPSERTLRTPLLLALGLHIAVLLFFLLLAAGPRLATSDLVLAAAVTASGGIMLAVGSRWSRRG
jgi:hypothetical protein